VRFQRRVMRYPPSTNLPRSPTESTLSPFPRFQSLAECGVPPHDPTVAVGKLLSRQTCYRYRRPRNPDLHGQTITIGLDQLNILDVLPGNAIRAKVVHDLDVIFVQGNADKNATDQGRGCHQHGRADGSNLQSAIGLVGHQRSEDGRSSSAGRVQHAQCRAERGVERARLLHAHYSPMPRQGSPFTDQVMARLGRGSSGLLAPLWPWCCPVGGLPGWA
jgi:hypothetical protein